MTHAIKPMVLLILDGWGYSEDPKNNAIMAANTPNFNRLWQQCPHTLISGSGLDVGLPSGQMGNSEVGHLNLGAGRVVYQDFTRITKSIEDGDFFENETLVKAVDDAIANNAAVHIMGLLSPGGVHSHEDHIIAMIEMAAKRGAKHIYVHGFLDGRDMPPRSAEPSIEKLDNLFKQLGVGKLASICGRYFAMDRDKRWDRVKSAYQLISEGQAEFQYDNGVNALNAAYARDENDEFVKPSVIGSPVKMEAHDAVIFMNYRADRARQLSQVFTDKNFSEFNLPRALNLSSFVTLTQYATSIDAPSAFPPLKHKNVLGEHLKNLGKTQLKIAETEKYAHVTFFFNGGIENPYEGEQRILIPSPQVATYDLQPEMNAPLMTDKLVDAISSQSFDVIVGNFANPDMVGHTGKFDAAVKAIEAIDQCLGRIVEALTAVGGEMLITADHGNAEKMADDTTGQAHTAHTSEPVPFIYFGRKAKVIKTDGVLADVAPTLLSLMELPIPAEMTGKPIMQLA